MKAEEMSQSATSLLCTVVVTTWRRPAALRNTLESLMRQTYPNIETIVVCDGEDHDVRALSEDFKGGHPVRWVFHPDNRGLAAARNTGAREAAGDVVLFMDDDIVADQELVNAHMHHHLSAGAHRRVVVCGRITEDPDRLLTSYLNRCLQDARNRIFDESTEALQASGAESIGDDIERGLWCGLNCSVGRIFFLNEGGFNEYFRASDEEMELGQRLHLAGFYFIFEPRAQLIHMNTKDWTNYYVNSYRHKGALDVYRVFELKQRNAQTQKLVSMFHGYFMNRCAARAAWHLAGPLRSLSHQLGKAANRTQSHLFFGVWARTAQAAEYWCGAKAAGCTLPRLKSVAGHSKCAVMLHSISDPRSDDESRYYVSPRRFRGLMRYFRAAGYTTATTTQWLEDDVSEKQVLLTFDDGYDDLYEELLPLVIEHGYTPVIFLVADHIASSNVWDQQSGLRARNLLTLAQIREMQKYGVEFGSHTMTHPWLPGVSDAQLHGEVYDSKLRLEDMIGVEITTFAYPFGGVDRRVRSAVADAGYKLAFTTEPGINWWNDPLCQRRAEVNDYTTGLDFACKLRNGRGCTETISVRLKNIEEEFPTKILRTMAKGVRRAGHELLHLFQSD
ncbi:MAG: polysaccharide deacetylase family protein [Acidobacteriota bacterium]|nr:polysaccharide deacetylase family protein [Acidobacteriota bacterium]